MTEVTEKENIFLFVPNLIGKHPYNNIFQLFLATASLIYSDPVTSSEMNKLWFMPFLCDVIDKSFFLGYARIFLAIVSFYFMQTNYMVAGWCYIISALLDAIDGHAARAFNQSMCENASHYKWP